MIRQLPDLAFKILKLLSEQGNLSQQAIEDQLQVNREDVKYAIRRLMENHIIFQSPNLKNMRTTYYRIAHPDEYDLIKKNVKPHLYKRIK